jgi:phosphoglycolate phosphatase
MSNTTTIIEALYNNFLLRDIFAKIVPGLLLVIAIVYKNSIGEGALDVACRLGWPTIIIGAGFAWVIGFAIQGIGEITKIIKHHPKSYTNSKIRYALRVNFKNIASLSESQQVERYAVIKEATGNGATSIILIIFVIFFRILIPNDLKFSWAIIFPGAVLISLAFMLLYASRNHARKQYEYMESVVSIRNQCAYLIKGIAFDFDGVIADSMPMQEKAWIEAIEKLGDDVTIDQKDALLRNFWSGSAGVQIFDDTGISIEIQSKLRETKDSIWKSERISVPAISGVVEAIREISKAFSLSISTTAPREYVVSNLKKFGILDHFAHIITNDDVLNPKPAPDALFKISQLLFIDHRELLMIGDTIIDYQMASKAGSNFVLFSKRKSPHLELEGVRIYSNWSSLAWDILYRRSLFEKMVQPCAVI